MQEELFYTLWTVFGRSPGGTTSGTGAGTRTEMRSGGDTKHPTNSEIVETSRSVSLLGSVTSPSTSPSRMPLGGTSPQGMGRTDGVPTTDLQGALALIKGSGVTVRGFYDVSAMRAAGDVMVWLHGPLPERLQAAVRALHRTQSFDQSSIVWSSMGVHRMAEFAKDHSPAFVRGLPPAAWACVYPFIRSYDWYLLPPEERRRMLIDHGSKGQAYSHVLTNTVAAFALGDYEWILALEAPELADLVDLMRDLRQADARRHVREEVPFYTGRRIAVDDLHELLQRF